MNSTDVDLKMDGSGEVHVIFGYQLLRSTLCVSCLNLIGDHLGL